MKLQEIQDLIKFIAKSGVNEVEIEQDNFKITIKADYMAQKKGGVKSAEPGTIIEAAVPQAAMPVAAPAPTPVAVDTPAPAPEAPAAKENSSGTDESNYVTIKSPMIGTFYRSPSPDKPPFVAVGDAVSTGSVICIVEAMKLFNEIESEVSGKIVKVLADDGNPVEYDTPLFLVDPS